MKTLFYLLQKEFRQIRRNRAILPMVFAVPIVQMMILVYAANFEMKNIDFVIIDNDLSETSRNLTSTFSGNAFFSVLNTPLSILQGEKMLQNNETDAMLIIPANFEKQLMRGENTSLQLLIDAVDGNKAQLIAGYTQSVIYRFNKGIIAGKPGAVNNAMPVIIDISENYWYNPHLDYKWFMAPGILTILVTVIGMFLSGLNLVREKEIGTIEQINVTPVRKSQFKLAKLIPFWFIALFDLAFGLAIARLLFNLPVEGSMLVLFSMTGIYLFGILGLGLFLSTMAETQ